MPFERAADVTVRSLIRPGDSIKYLLGNGAGVVE
jgi:hypothetical protein